MHQSTLQKRNLKQAPLKPVKVVSVFDVSGSAEGLFTRAGPDRSAPPMQEAFDRILAIAGNLDDDGTMEVYAFSNNSWRLADASLSEYGSYIHENIVRNSSIDWGGTSYAPVLERVIQAYTGTNKIAAAATTVQQQAAGLFTKVASFFGKKEQAPAAAPAPVASSPTPAVVYFFTDGDNNDMERTRSVLADAASRKYPIYFVMVGVGPGLFANIRQLADQFSNVGFVSISDVNISDEAAYDAIVSEEFVQWLNINA